MVASDWNLWRSLESMLLLQQLNCVSMFYLCPVSNKLKVSVLSKFYAITIKIIIITLLAISMTYFRCFTLVLSLLPQGFLWKLLTGYELISVSVHCVLNIILLFVTKEKQMQFLQRINKIDQTIAHEFDDRVDHKRYRQALAYAIVVFTFYYYGLVLTASYIAYYFKKYILILFAWIYESQHIMLASITYTCTNYIFLIYVRFNLLLRICQRLQTDFATPTISDDEKQQRVHKLQKLFKLFKELSESVKMIDDFSGWNLLLAMIQDFTLSLIQWYLLFHIIWEKQELSREYYVIGILYWSLGTFAKVIALGTATNLAISQANRCKMAFQWFYRNCSDRDLIQLCQHFELWSYHHPIRFSAKEFVPMDNQFYFTGLSGLSTYLIILVQFKLQEDEIQNNQIIQ